jgi:hypothetical protein
MGFRNKPTAPAAPKTVVFGHIEEQELLEAVGEAPEAEQNDEPAEAIDAAGEETPETAEAPAAPAPAPAAPAAPKPAKAPKAAEKAPSFGSEALVVSRGATLLEVPLSSPYYKPLLRALKGLEDSQKALAGE